MRHLPSVVDLFARLAIPEQLRRPFRRHRTHASLETLPRVGGLATIPTRAETLGAVLDKVVPQLDRLHLFLHGYASIPDTAQRQGVVPYLAPKEHTYRASGKFFGLTLEERPCLYFCFDDDILYRQDYVEVTRRRLLAYGDYAAVGYHAICFNRQNQGYMKQKRFSFRRKARIDREVDALGTGTLAFASNLLNFDPSVWPYGDMDDLMFAQEAARRGIPLISLAREAGLMAAIAQGQPDSLTRTAHLDSSRHDAEMRRLIDIRKAGSQG